MLRHPFLRLERLCHFPMDGKKLTLYMAINVPFIYWHSFHPWKSDVFIRGVQVLEMFLTFHSIPYIL